MDWSSLIWVGLGAGIAGFAVFARQGEQLRAEAFKRAARSTGLSVRKGERRFRERFPGLGIFGRPGAAARRALSGNAGDRFAWLVDLRWTSGREKRRRLVGVLEDPVFDLPHFHLRPRLLAEDLDGLAGPEVDFSDAQAFREVFVVQGEPELKVRARFSPKVRELLLALEGPPVEIEGSGSALAVAFTEDLPPEKGAWLLEIAERLAEALSQR